MFQADLPHVFPASRISISALEGQLQDLTERFASLKSLTTNDSQLLPLGYALPAVCVNESNVNGITEDDGDEVVDGLAIATTTTTPRTSAYGIEIGSSTKSPSAKLFKISHQKSSLRETTRGDCGRNFQHFDNVKDVSISGEIGVETRQAGNMDEEPEIMAAAWTPRKKKQRGSRRK